MMIWLPWVIFALVVLAVIVFSFGWVRYFSDIQEAEALPTIVTTAGLVVVLLTVALIPVDVYTVSQTLDPGEVSSHMRAVELTYYVLFCCILFLAFVAVPFTYFYYEEGGEDVTTNERIWAGAKYTTFTFLIVVVLLVVGLFLKNKDAASGDASEIVQHFKDIGTTNAFQDILMFAVYSAAMIGMVVMCIYTAYGMSALPIGFMKGSRHVDEDRTELQTNLALIREKSRMLNSKYLGGRNMSSKDRLEVEKLQREERILARQSARLEESQQGLWSKIVMVSKPFMFIFGIVGILFSLVLIGAIVLTTLDQLLNSIGASAGYTLIDEHKAFFNPLDVTLVFVSNYYPCDFILLAVIILWIFACTMSGLIRIGIRFMWLLMYKIKPHYTAPQGLLLAVLFQMFNILALLVILFAMAPQYMTFGSQMYTNSDGDSVHCSKTASFDGGDGSSGSSDGTDGNPATSGGSASDGSAVCVQTAISTFQTNLFLRVPFIGVVMLWATAGFVLCYVLGLCVAIFKRRSSNVERLDSDSDEDDLLP